MSTSKEDYFFLDVREEDEFNLDSVPKSFNMPVRKVLSVGYGFSSGFWEKMIPKNKILVLYCSTGRRSRMAEDALVKKGYQIKNVSTLEKAKKFYNTITD